MQEADESGGECLEDGGAVDLATGQPADPQGRDLASALGDGDSQCDENADEGIEIPQAHDGGHDGTVFVRGDAVFFCSHLSWRHDRLCPKSIQLGSDVFWVGVMVQLQQERGRPVEEILGNYGPVDVESVLTGEGFCHA